MPTGPTSYPTSLDSFPTVTSATFEDDSGFEHDLLHDWEMTANSALQKLVGTAGPNEHPVMQQLVALRSDVANLRSIANESRVNVDSLMNNPSSDPFAIHVISEVFGS